MLGSTKLFVLFVAALLVSCAQQPLRDVTLRPARESIQQYSIEGRVSVKRGNEARQAGIHWQHEIERDEMELTGPLGQKAARLIRDTAGAKLETSSHDMQTANDWSGLAERVLGVALPLDNMSKWVVGDVAEEAVLTRDFVGRAQSANVDGWQLDYRAYESDSPNALPTVIELRRDDIWVKLKIEEWEIGRY